jgi:hypothetical protein
MSYLVALKGAVEVSKKKQLDVCMMMMTLGDWMDGMAGWRRRGATEAGLIHTLLSLLILPPTLTGIQNGIHPLHLNDAISLLLKLLWRESL